ncbi:MAG: PTS fructose transporter subunit IIA, partial [Methylophilaceae bacterium]
MIGILIVAHGNLGDSLIQCATHVMGSRPPQLEQF